MIRNLCHYGSTLLENKSRKALYYILANIPFTVTNCSILIKIVPIWSYHTNNRLIDSLEMSDLTESKAAIGETTLSKYVNRGSYSHRLFMAGVREKKIELDLQE
jgi:hypothetical protein